MPKAKEFHFFAMATLACLGTVAHKPIDKGPPLLSPGQVIESGLNPTPSVLGTGMAKQGNKGNHLLTTVDYRGTCNPAVARQVMPGAYPQDS